MGYTVAIGVFFIGIFIGAVTSDQTTIRNCATKNKAQLAGNVTIECHVKKDNTP